MIMMIKHLILSPVPCSSAATEVHVQLRGGLYDSLHLRLLQVICSIWNNQQREETEEWASQYTHTAGSLYYSASSPVLTWWTRCFNCTFDGCRGQTTKLLSSLHCCDVLTALWFPAVPVQVFVEPVWTDFPQGCAHGLHGNIRSSSGQGCGRRRPSTQTGPGTHSGGRSIMRRQWRGGLRVSTVCRCGGVWFRGTTL